MIVFSLIDSSTFQMKKEIRISIFSMHLCKLGLRYKKNSDEEEETNCNLSQRFQDLSSYSPHSLFNSSTTSTIWKHLLKEVSKHKFGAQERNCSLKQTKNFSCSSFFE